MTMIDALLSPGRRRALAGVGALGVVAAAGSVGAYAWSRRDALQPAAQRFSGLSMGTGYVVKIAGTPLPAARLETLQADVEDALAGVDRSMSLYRGDSELSRLNRHGGTTPVALSREMVDVLAVGQRVAALTEGAFDLSIAPLVQTWGFGLRAQRAVPADERVRAGRAALGQAGLVVDAAARSATKAPPTLQFDLSGIAKGYAVDRAALALEKRGVERYMIEVGGEVRTAGLNAAGQPWRIGIEEPDAMPQRARIVVPLVGGAMATSGDYRIYFEDRGRRYGHIIDPATGAPASGLASVSIVADDCVHADAMATGLFVLGLPRALALAEARGLAAHFIERRGGALVDHRSTAFAALATANAAAG